MSVSGALFDIAKLDDISKTVISVMDCKKVLNFHTNGQRNTASRLQGFTRQIPNMQLQFLT